MQTVRSKGKHPTPKSARSPLASPLDKANGYEVIWPNVSALFTAYRGMSCSFVYFIGERDGGTLKIGRAKNPIDRLRSMQTGNPRRLVLEHVLVGGNDVEKLFHEIWEPFAIVSDRNKTAVKDRGPGTEWFQPEIRETLFPVVAAAASRQIALREEDRPLVVEEFELAAWKAHVECGTVLNSHDPTFNSTPEGVFAARSSRVNRFGSFVCKGGPFDGQEVEIHKQAKEWIFWTQHSGHIYRRYGKDLLYSHEQDRHSLKAEMDAA